MGIWRNADTLQTTHTLTQFFHQHKKRLYADFKFSTLTSPVMRQKPVEHREVCGMNTKMLGNHWPGQGVTAQNWEDLQSVSYRLLDPLVVVMTLMCLGENY